MKKIYNDILPFKGFAAMYFCGLLFIRREVGELSASTLNHEAIHDAQAREMLYLPFYVVYVIEWFVRLFIHGPRAAYRNISFEREAYARQGERDYLTRRRRYAWWRYIRK